MDLALVFPHQLFDRHPAIVRRRPVAVIEDPLFFGDPVVRIAFHRQKTAFHRASMSAFAARLRRQGFDVRHIEYAPGRTTADALKLLAAEGLDRWHVVDPTDWLLERRLRRAAEQTGARIQWLDSPMFLTSKDWNAAWLADRPRPSMRDYYVAQRRRLGVLLDGAGAPLGGRWSFDTENRRRLPREYHPPPEPRAAPDGPARRAIRWAEATFAASPGQARDLWIPIDHAGARRWLETFVAERLNGFGDYEDAISADATVLHHSVLSPLLNCGLLTPDEVLNAVLDAARERTVPLNSLEGFVRQLIGWREFIRAVYERDGVAMRTRNFWGHRRRLSRRWWTATTGLAPVDLVVGRVVARAWCHHIERLMVLGNAMLLCETDPDEVYGWFMGMFLDAYDWVMVPNVYGMSQFSDGGTFATKPYVGGSNYLRKMSDIPDGPWSGVWDALFWTFIARRRPFFVSQPRLSVLLRHLDRIGASGRAALERRAEAFMGEVVGG